jgi:hypothetical protein
MSTIKDFDLDLGIFDLRREHPNKRPHFGSSRTANCHECLLPKPVGSRFAPKVNG